MQSMALADEPELVAKNRRKLLEWELSLSWRDMRSNAWFHGQIGRSTTESLLQTSGQFLVRNCSSRTDEYVLSTRSDVHVLHFVITRRVLNANTDYQMIRYAFEDDSFDTISDLITFYVGNKRPISFASQAIITTPVNRTHPLTNPQTIQNKNREELIHKMKHNLQTFESFSAEDIAVTDGPSTTMSRTPPPKPSRIPVNGVISLSSDEVTSEATEQKLSNMSLNCDNLSESSGHSSHKNESNGSEDSAFFSENLTPKQTEETKYDVKDTAVTPNEPNSDTKAIQTLLSPTYCSQIKAKLFYTYLLPKDNKPLDSSAIIKIQSVLEDTGPRILANHLTKCDLDFIRLLDVNHCFGLEISSVFELILLPNGQQMRLDLLERHKCLKYFVCITILTAINDEKRALILNKWIEIANEIKTALGNLFGFGAVMDALSMEPILKLKTIWSLVRIKYTQNAITYETKLRPQLKSMTECTEPQAPNTCFPFVLTLIQILERHTEIVESSEKVVIKNGKSVSKQSEYLGLWFEQTSVDCGLQQILSHLESGPQLIEQLATYRRNGRIVLDDIKLEELLTDMFRSEFHRQFLFGFRGSDIDNQEKFDKFDKIIAALVRKCEPDVQF